jgi:ribosomal-protein-alanine N-acetyltransferase
MRPDDLPAVMGIEEAVFVGDAWTENIYRRDLTNPDARYVVLELLPSAGEVLGYAGFWLFEDEAHLMTLAVAPRWQGHGLGAWLILDVLDLMEALGVKVCTLEVRVGNLRAQALYTNVGFHVAGRRRRYYADNGEDALIMTTPSLSSPEMRALRDKRRSSAENRLRTLLPG